MSDVEQTVSLPPNANQLAQSLKKVFTDVLAAKQAGASGATLITEAVVAAVTDLAGAIPHVAEIGAEGSADPVGVAEAFAIAGFDVARLFVKK